MPLESEDLCHLTAAQGYVELGMLADANAEVEEIDHDVRHVPEVLEVRLAIYSAIKMWELMETVAKRLALFVPKNVLFVPKNVQWSISWAYATRRVHCIESARQILVNALDAHPNEAVIHYNRTCNESQLGNIGEGQRRLDMAFKLDAGLRATALEDLDLEPLWRSSLGP